MYQVGKQYICEENGDSWSFQVTKVRGNKVTISYGEGKSCTCSRAELDLAKPVLIEEVEDEEKDVEEDVVDTGNVEQGVKTDYKGLVTPQFKKKRLHEELLNSVGAYVDRVDLSEESYVEYNSYTKIATLFEGNENKKLRVTNTDWERYWEEVVSQLGGYNE